MAEPERPEFEGRPLERSAPVGPVVGRDDDGRLYVTLWPEAWPDHKRPPAAS